MLTTVTTVTTATLFHTEALGAIAVATLIVLLIAKELLSAHENEEAENMSIREKRLLSPNLNMAILPMLFCFALIVCAKVMEVL